MALESRNKFQKAQIELLTGTLKGEKVEVLFNPNQYSIDKSNQFAEVAIPGLESPLIQFVQGNIKTLTMELFFDTYTYEQGKDVRKEYTSKIMKLMEMDSETHAPPVCMFSWGTLKFKCVFQRIRQNFTMFNADGTPVRATLNVTFKEYKTPKESQKNPGAPAKDTKRRVVKQGETLHQIAAEDRGDAADWRPIAQANNIENPRLLEPGVEIVIPL